MGKDVLEIKTPLTVSIHFIEAPDICARLSVTRTVKEPVGQVFATDAIPLITPEGAKLRPEGRDPAVMENE